MLVVPPFFLPKTNTFRVQFRRSSRLANGPVPSKDFTLSLLKGSKWLCRTKKLTARASLSKSRCTLLLSFSKHLSFYINTVSIRSFSLKCNYENQSRRFVPPIWIGIVTALIRSIIRAALTTS